ncbi:MAG: hypothetical protein AAF235_05510 [Planctomycetota bacterium]
MHGDRYHAIAVDRAEAIVELVGQRLDLGRPDQHRGELLVSDDLGPPPLIGIDVLERVVEFIAVTLRKRDVQESERHAKRLADPAGVT